MDVVRTVNEANLILPAGDVKIGPYDYNVYANSQINAMKDINLVPLKTVGEASVLVARRGQGAGRLANPVQQSARQRPGLGLSAGPETGRRRQHHRGGQRRQAGRLPPAGRAQATGHPGGVRPVGVRASTAIENLIHEGAIGLVLTGLMILVFLGSMRATVAVFLSIPLSALAAFIALALGGSTINAMILGGLALAFSRLIDNSVVVLENIFRHLEMGEPPEVAAERGGQEVALPVLAATLTSVVVFFPGDLSLRRQPVPVQRAGAVGGAVAVCLLFRGDDGGAAVLRELDQRPSRRTSWGSRATPAPQSWGAALQRLVQPQVQPDARPLRRHR